MMQQAIEAIVNGRSLTFAEAAEIMTMIMTGETTPAQIAALVTALRCKGETADEIAGMASVMRDKAIPVKVTPPVIDTCGMGGDNSATFNISTAAALVAAGGGLRVAKHGNRAMSSCCGSADVLEALGVKIDLGAEAVTECIERTGFGFMLATVFHPAMKFAAVPRREIGIRTVFNILGPLTNPARAEFQVIGVPSAELGEKVALVLNRLGTKHALVVHGLEGVDEIATSGKSRLWEVNERGVLPPYEVSPRYFGFKEASLEQLRGGTARDNAQILKRILSGEHGPARNAVVMNAAAALFIGNKASELKEGARLAEEVIDSGQAQEKLDSLIQLSQSLDP
jgi:anthranilate phosphoribosyltransferase